MCQKMFHYELDDMPIVDDHCTSVSPTALWRWQENSLIVNDQETIDDHA